MATPTSARRPLHAHHRLTMLHLAPLLLAAALLPTAPLAGGFVLGGVSVGVDDRSLAAQDPPAAETIAPVAPYDPLAARLPGEPTVLALEVVDAERDRTLPVRVWLPPVLEPDAKPAGDDAAPRPTPAPLVVFSHGLGGSCENNPYLGRHWTARGYAVVYVQHPGSDESVWRGVPLRERMAALRAAASTEQFLARVADIPALLDQLRAWNTDPSTALFGRLDLERIGMSGHSFGAVTTQWTSGQAAGAIGRRYTDARIDAALAMSPSSPSAGDPVAAFGRVSVPWMLMTGTDDGGVIGDQTPASRREVYPYLPASIDRYELVLDGAEHSAFSERALPGERGSRNDNHHRAILALSTAFWDAHLTDDAAARAWLAGDGPREVLEEADVWQRAAAGEQTASAGTTPDDDTRRREARDRQRRR